MTVPLLIPRPLSVRLRERWQGAVARGAVAAGTAVRWSRRPARMAPGAAGAALIAYGAALVYLPAGFIAGGAFLLWFGSELNRVPPPPRRDDTNDSY